MEVFNVARIIQTPVSGTGHVQVVYKMVSDKH